MSHDMQWIHKGSSCILLWSSMSKVSCLQIHKDRKEISSSFVTKEKIIFNRRPRIKNPICQIRLNDRLNINAELIYLPMRGLWRCSISDSSIMCVTCLYELLYNYLWSRLLHPNSAKNSGAQRDRPTASDFSSNLQATGPEKIYS